LAWANETLQITRRLYEDLDNDELGAVFTMSGTCRWSRISCNGQEFGLRRC
jgi:hypothetical protein